MHKGAKIPDNPIIITTMASNRQVSKKAEHK